MTPYEPTGILVAGRPHTGKTSYLAVLYLAIVNERATGLRLGSFRDDREYLNRISQRLQTCEPADHTEVDEQQELSLSLLVGSTGVPTLLRIPDTSGETWEAALTTRRWPVELDTRVREANAVMIFTHPKVDFDPGVTIVQANAAEAALRHGTDSAPYAGTREPDERAPTQVELVDLLQLLREQRGPRPTRACLVVSAYDLVSPQVRPVDWMRRNCPLFAQYADVNQDWLDVAVYGVSAQGGSFVDGQVRDELTRQDAVERCSVLSSDGTVVGVDDPILWMLQARD
jgi:hypothetical protein